MSACFISKVPNCNNIKKSNKAGAHKRANSDSDAVQQFMSSTKREDQWLHKMEAPFNKPQTAGYPGPGKYNIEKKKDDVKTKILMEETVKIPFNSSDERGCNKPQPDSVPGPGSYIDINNPQNSSVCKPMLKF